MQPSAAIAVADAPAPPPPARPASTAAPGASQASAAAQGAPPPGAATPAAPRSPLALQVLAVLAVVAALWWGARFLIPVVAGLLLVMLAEPAVSRVQRWLPSRTLAAALVLGATVAAAVVLLHGFSGQLLRMTERLPDVIRLAASELATDPSPVESTLRRARDALQELDQAMDRRNGEPPPPRRARPPARAQAPVEGDAASAPKLSDNATAVITETAVAGSGKLLVLAADLTVALFVAFFVLAGGPSLAGRFVQLWPGCKARRRAAAALRECARQARLYAGVLVITNVAIGAGVWLWFKVFGIGDALTWALAAALLHLVPYLGMAVFSVLAAAEAYLTYGQVGAALTTAGVVIALSTLIGTVVTAWLQGRAARMNPAAVFIGVVFWGVLWGVWGLFLGPALIVAAKVCAAHHPGSRRWARLLAA